MHQPVGEDCLLYTSAALIATTSIVPVSAADVEFQDEVSAETPDTEAEEVSEAPEAEVQEQEDITLTTEENTDCLLYTSVSEIRKAFKYQLFQILSTKKSRNFFISAFNLCTKNNT